MRSYSKVDKVPLNSPIAASIVSYPYSRPQTRRDSLILESLAMQGITSFLLRGNKRLHSVLGEIPVLGKGHSSIVVLASDASGRRIAVKILRADTRKRESLAYEARLLGLVHRCGAAPRVYSWHKYFIIMDFVSGPPIGEALTLFRRDAIVAEALATARAIDACRVLHRELSRADHHLLFTGSASWSKLLAIDFESASHGKCGNVPRIVSWLARKGLVFVDEKLRRVLGLYRREGCPSRLYKVVLEKILWGF